MQISFTMEKNSDKGQFQSVSTGLNLKHKNGHIGSQTYFSVDQDPRGLLDPKTILK